MTEAAFPERTQQAPATGDGRLARYLDFLGQDPRNPNLLNDAANAAIDAGETDIALDLLDRLAGIVPLTPAQLNLKGMALLRKGEAVVAAKLFSDLVEGGHDDPSLRFNLAWAKALLADHVGALALLDEAVLGTTPQAPVLRIQSLHHLGQLDDALAEGTRLLDAQPGNTTLAGALSTVAMDAGDMASASAFAARGGDSSDALITRGLIALSSHQSGDAATLLDHALEVRPAHPRAWLGRGLVRLKEGDAAAATRDLEAAARQFGRHIGSWLAAGWAYFLQGDVSAARRCFETALALDANFAESHGSLAVLDIVSGKIEPARRQTAVALRLDRQCFSGALAKSLLAEHDHNPLLAHRIRERAMAIAIGPNGETIAQAIAAIGLVPGTPRNRPS